MLFMSGKVAMSKEMEVLMEVVQGGRGDGCAASGAARG